MVTHTHVLTCLTHACSQCLVCVLTFSHACAHALRTPVLILLHIPVHTCLTCVLTHHTHVRVLTGQTVHFLLAYALRHPMGKQEPGVHLKPLGTRVDLREEGPF